MPKVRQLDPVFEIETRIFDYIRRTMREKGITQTDIAKELGMYQSNISYKFSKKQFYLDDIIRIFRFLGTDAETIGELMS